MSCDYTADPLSNLFDVPPTTIPDTPVREGDTEVVGVMTLGRKSPIKMTTGQPPPPTNKFKTLERLYKPSLRINIKDKFVFGKPSKSLSPRRESSVFDTLQLKVKGFLSFILSF